MDIIYDKIGYGVGNYQLCFDTIVVPLNKVQEDKLIRSKEKGFIVLRHATYNEMEFSHLFNKKDLDKITINFNHEVYENQTNDGKILESKVNNAELIYMALENECSSISEYKIVLRFNPKDLHFANSIKDK